MAKKARNTIGYRDLQANILEPGFCSLCGACEAACPLQALSIEGDRLRQVHDCSEHVEFCPICYDVCPHSETLLMEALSFVSDAPHTLGSLGNYRKILLAQATDPKLRELSHGGGVITAILRDDLKKGVIDSAVVSNECRNESLKSEPSISLVPDDIISAVDAEYFPSAVGKAFGRAVHDYGKTRIAFVGTPCQVLAIRKLESWEHKIKDNLSIVIGLMCLWSFSFKHLLEGIEKEHGIKKKEIQKITLDKKYFIHMRDKVAMIPVTDAKKHVLGSCSTCLDYTSQLADLSIGGAYPTEGWSIVMVRTEKGEQVFESAVQSGVVSTKNIEECPEAFSHLVEMAKFKRRVDLEETNRILAAGRIVPPARLRLLRPLPKERWLLSSLNVDEIMTSKVMTVTRSATVKELFEVMMKYRHMGYPVMDEDQNLVGIATFEDIMKTNPEERDNLSVGNIEQKKLVTVYADDTVLKAYEKMIEHRIGRVLVVDHKNPKKLLGIVTRTDILQTLRWPMRSR